MKVPDLERSVGIRSELERERARRSVHLTHLAGVHAGREQEQDTLQPERDLDGRVFALVTDLQRPAGRNGELELLALLPHDDGQPWEHAEATIFRPRREVVVAGQETLHVNDPVVADSEPETRSEETLARNSGRQDHLSGAR